MVASAGLDLCPGSAALGTRLEPQLGDFKFQSSNPDPLDTEGILGLTSQCLRGVLAAEAGPQAQGEDCQTSAFCMIAVLAHWCPCLFSTAHHNSPPGLNSPLSNNSAMPPTQTPEMPQPRPFRLESLDIPFSKAKRKKSKSSFGGEPL